MRRSQATAPVRRCLAWRGPVLARVVECGTSLLRLLGVAGGLCGTGLLDPLCGLGRDERAQQGGFLPRLLRGLRGSCGLLCGVGGEVRLLVAGHRFRAEYSRVCRESCGLCSLGPVQKRVARCLVLLFGVDHAWVAVDSGSGDPLHPGVGAFVPLRRFTPLARQSLVRFVPDSGGASFERGKCATSPSLRCRCCTSFAISPRGLHSKRRSRARAASFRSLTTSCR